MISEKGSRSGTVAYCCETLGALYTEINRYEEAEEQLTYVLEIYNKHVDSDPDDYERVIAGVYSNMSEMYYNSKRYEKAAESAEAATKQIDRLVKRNLFRCIQRNMTNAKIATELFLSEESVRVNTYNLLKKLPVESKSDISGWMESFALS